MWTEIHGCLFKIKLIPHISFRRKIKLIDSRISIVEVRLSEINTKPRHWWKFAEFVEAERSTFVMELSRSPEYWSSNSGILIVVDIQGLHEITASKLTCSETHWVHKHLYSIMPFKWLNWHQKEWEKEMVWFVWSLISVRTIQEIFCFSHSISFYGLTKVNLN